VSDSLNQPTAEEMEQEIAEELLRIHLESYGGGAARVRAHVLDDSVIVFLDDLEFLPNEQFMIDRGHDDSVLQIRHQYQQAIQAPYRAAVERATGRKVVSFVSATKLDPNYSVEVFRLDSPVG
jgi:uncharacterized protein YbcI